MHFQVDEITLDVALAPIDSPYKDWGPKTVTIYFPIFNSVKSSENNLFFTCILPNYVANEITKEF